MCTTWIAVTVAEMVVTGGGAAAVLGFAQPDIIRAAAKSSKPGEDQRAFMAAIVKPGTLQRVALEAWAHNA